MSMSTHVAAVIPPDEEWKKMKAVWDAVSGAKGVPMPPEVVAFFGDEPPDEAGVVHRLAGGNDGCEWTADRKNGTCVEVIGASYKGGSGVGVVLDLAKLPAGVTKIRVRATE